MTDLLADADPMRLAPKTEAAYRGGPRQWIKDCRAVGVDPCTGRVTLPPDHVPALPYLREAA